MNAQHTPGPDEIAAFRLAIDDGISDVGMTYDNDPESPRSVAYDVGRTVAELPEPWQSLLAAAPALLAACEAALPWLSLLGDFIGNGVESDKHNHGTPIGPMGRCDAIGAIKNAIRLARGS